MKKSLCKNSLVYGIIILFIGLGFTSSIGGNFEKMSNPLTKKSLTNNPLNINNYVQAYWKFDEGNGNILGDSSSNNFDGTINGATWTTGHSGYALDFDGVDDYVALDAYSGDLGFNKTDDLVFSFYFKSTSTDSGMIYSIAGINNIPETRVELLSNGSISFRAWTNVCGIFVYTNGTYNDGVWHNVEIWYNGITANPTINIYVDNNPDGNVTDWLCDIHHTDFKNAKIGRRAYSNSDYFDGLIDEFKIIKYPGGNQQNAPEISGPTSGESGVEYEFTFVTYDPEEDNIRLYIDWDDGEVEEWIGPFQSGEEVTVSHTWYENRVYEIRAQSRDVWDDGSWTYHLVSIGNHPPDAPVITGPTNARAGVEYEYDFSLFDPDDDSMYLRVDWGSGTPEPWQGPYDSGKIIKFKHTWNEQGTYTIRAQAKDIYNAEGSWGTLDVTMPKNKVLTNSLSLRFLQSFSILQKLLVLIK